MAEINLTTIFLTSSSVTMQNLVAVFHTVCSCPWRCWGHPPRPWDMVDVQ